MAKNPDKTVKITVYAEDRKRLKELAARRGETMSETFKASVDAMVQASLSVIAKLKG